MFKTLLIGLGFAGLALWLGQKAGAQIKEKVGGAHTPDGQDASKSFNAGIADENSIPGMMPAL